jgi:hypothetical protein
MTRWQFVHYFFLRNFAILHIRNANHVHDTENPRLPIIISRFFSPFYGSALVLACRIWKPISTAQEWIPRDHWCSCAWNLLSMTSPPYIWRVKWGFLDKKSSCEVKRSFIRGGYCWFILIDYLLSKVLPLVVYNMITLSILWRKKT